MTDCAVFIYVLCAAVVVGLLLIVCLLLNAEHVHRNDHLDDD